VGQVFKRTYRDKHGTVRTCETWTIRYYRNGRPHQEATKFTKKGDAERRLKVLEGRIASGEPISARSARYRFEDAADAITDDYRVNGRRSLDNVERRIRLHLLPYFAGRRMADITTADVVKYTNARLLDGAAPGGVNRELAALKRMFSLALRASILTFKPHIPMLTEDNTRAGFVDDAQLDAIVSHLPASAAAVVRFAYITGWRIQSEVLPMEWRQVDRVAGEVRLDAGTTKNRAGRVFPFTEDLRRLFDQLWQEHEALRAKGVLCPAVFHRNGRRIRSIRGAWAKACTAAGCPGRIPHDLRRSAVRNMERRGLSRSVAMALTGHKTEAVYRRYAITAESDLLEAVRRLDRDSFRDSETRSGRMGRGKAR
jgi:integrase